MESTVNTVADRRVRRASRGSLAHPSPPAFSSIASIATIAHPFQHARRNASITSPNKFASRKLNLPGIIHRGLWPIRQPLFDYDIPHKSSERSLLTLACSRDGDKVEIDCRCRNAQVATEARRRTEPGSLLHTARARSSIGSVEGTTTLRLRLKAVHNRLHPIIRPLPHGPCRLAGLRIFKIPPGKIGIADPPRSMHS